MMSMEDLKREQKNLDGILAILCILCGNFFMILPVRMKDFIQITGSDLYLFRFCQDRWVEDIKVSEQAL